MSEEQIEETETLLAIYGDDMEMKSTTPYRFKIKLSVPPTDEDEDNDMIVVMDVTFPNEYPNEPPEIELLSKKGVRDSECETLRKEFLEKFSEHAGTQMIFTFASYIQDWMIDAQQEELNPQSSKNKATDFQLSKDGTPVTRDSFLEWKKAFDEEMRMKNAVVQMSNLKSGRELFEQDASLINTDDDAESVEGEVFVEDASLFEEDPGLDLEDE